MRGNVLQTWTPTLLLSTVLVITAATPTARHRTGTIDVPRLFESASPTEYCALPAPTAVGRRLEVAQRMGPRQTAAMFVMLMGQRRFGGFGH